MSKIALDVLCLLQPRSEAGHWWGVCVCRQTVAVHRVYRLSVAVYRSVCEL